MGQFLIFSSCCLGSCNTFSSSTIPGELARFFKLEASQVRRVAIFWNISEICKIALGTGFVRDELFYFRSQPQITHFGDIRKNGFGCWLICELPAEFGFSPECPQVGHEFCCIATRNLENFRSILYSSRSI